MRAKRVPLWKPPALCPTRYANAQEAWGFWVGLEHRLRGDMLQSENWVAGGEVSVKRKHGYLWPGEWLV